MLREIRYPWLDLAARKPHKVFQSCILIHGTCFVSAPGSDVRKARQLLGHRSRYEVEFRLRLLRLAKARIWPNNPIAQSPRVEDRNSQSSPGSAFYWSSASVGG